MGTRESEQLKNLSMKIQEVTSNVAVTVKKKKNYACQTNRDTKRHFQTKLPLIWFY